MEKPNAQGKARPSSQHFNLHVGVKADQEERLKELREQKELIRLRTEKELWRKASQIPKVFPDLRVTQEKNASPPDRSNFFTKLRLGKLLG